MSAFSKQVGGGHYTKMKIQPFQYSMANGLDPMQHTIIKYVTRFRDKNGIEDLEKAKHTIDLLIEHELQKAAPATEKPVEDVEQALRRKLEDGEARAHIVTTSYDRAQAIAIYNGWDSWVYIPASAWVRFMNQLDGCVVVFTEDTSNLAQHLSSDQYFVV